MQNKDKVHSNRTGYSTKPKRFVKDDRVFLTDKEFEGLSNDSPFLNKKDFLALKKQH